MGPISLFSHFNNVEPKIKKFKLDCPYFDGMDFKGQWSKLEQFFKAEGVEDDAKVQLVMLHLEGKALDCHHFFAQRQKGLHQLSWEGCIRGLQARFGSDIYQDPMEELVPLK